MMSVMNSVLVLSMLRLSMFLVAMIWKNFVVKVFGEHNHAQAFNLDFNEVTVAGLYNNDMSFGRVLQAIWREVAFRSLRFDRAFSPPLPYHTFHRARMNYFRSDPLLESDGVCISVFALDTKTG